MNRDVGQSERGLELCVSGRVAQVAAELFGTRKLWCVML